VSVIAVGFRKGRVGGRHTDFHKERSLAAQGEGPRENKHRGEEDYENQTEKNKFGSSNADKAPQKELLGEQEKERDSRSEDL